MRIPIKCRLACLFLLLAPAAQAHTGHAGGSACAAGFTHPLGGWDHILAMVAVGLWAAQLGGKARRVVPIAFVAAMSLGGALAAVGVNVGMAEQGILASVLVLGLLIAAAARVALPAAAVMVGAFAIFHGYAHVVEMRHGDSLLEYAGGFILATAILHALGLGLGALLQQSRRPMLIRVCGGVVTLAAVALWIGAR